MQPPTTLKHFFIDVPVCQLIETTHKHTWRFTFEKSPPVAPRGTSWHSLNRKRNNLTFGEDMLMGNVYRIWHPIPSNQSMYTVYLNIWHEYDMTYIDPHLGVYDSLIQANLHGCCGHMQVQLTRRLVPPSPLKNASAGHHVASHQSWLRHANQQKKQKHPAIVSSCHVKEMLENKNSVQLDEPTKKITCGFCLVLFHNTHVCHFIGRNHLPKINLLSSPQRLENLNKNYARPPDPPCSIRFWLVQKNELTNNIKFNSTIDLLSDVNTHIAHQICIFVRFPTTFSTSTR